MVTKRVSALFSVFVLVSISFFTTITVHSADKSEVKKIDKTAIPIRMAPVYGFAGAERGVTSTGKAGDFAALGIAATDAVGLLVSYTAYDYQHNCSMGHQIEHRGTRYVYMGWMDQQGYVLGVGRRGAIHAYDLIDCDWELPNPKVFTADYGGYVNMEVDQTGCAVPAAHEGADADSQRPRAYFDFCMGVPLGAFQSDYPTDVYGWYQNNGTGPGNQNLWPIIEWQLGGIDPVLHMVTCESGGAAGDPQTISYYRRVGAYGAGLGTWSAQKVIDTVMNINPVLATSPATGRMAIVWDAPADYLGDNVGNWNQYANDVWYAISTNAGLNLLSVTGSIGHAVATGTLPGANITQYDPLSDWKAYCNLAALITTDENLHVVWGCRKWTDTTSVFRRQSAIFHWSEDVPHIRTVVKAEWDTGGACYADTWSSDVDKMSIAECDGKLYILYAQFGNANEPCVDYGANKKVMNGELYMTVSNNQGLNWDKPQNLTNSRDPLCADGNCNSDMWPSMVRYGRTDVNGCGGIAPGTKALDILYINDKSPGGAVQTASGVWTTNPVMWLATPCREPVMIIPPIPPVNYGECFGEPPLWVQPDHDTTIVLTIENPGLMDNHFTIDISYTHGSGWISVIPMSGTIPTGLNNTVDLTMTFTAPPGAPSPSTWVGKISINHEGEGSPTEIGVCLEVAEVEYFSQSVDLATTCKRIRLWNDGHLVNNKSGFAMDYIADCDTFNANTMADIYLYDGSPIVCRIDEGGDTLRFCAYSNVFYHADALRPQALWTVDNSNADYTKAGTMYSTGDTTVGFLADYYIPTADSNCEFIIEKLRFFNMTEATLNGVLIGEFLDWDVPSDSGSRNGSGYDITRTVMYQFGGEYNQDDSTEALCDQESSDRYAGIAVGPDMPFRNAMTLDNATYVYTSGPYGSAAPLPPGAMYKLMKNGDGFSMYSSTDPDSLYTDLSTLVTFGEYNLFVGDTICVVHVLATSKTGQAASASAIDAGKAFIAAHAWMDCGLCTCCNLPGDANNDGKRNVGDAVFIISYVFRGGPPPACFQEGDANGDCKINVGDAVYMINHVFRGGPAPICNPECDC
jgi:hypothetical protein